MTINFGKVYSSPLSRQYLVWTFFFGTVLTFLMTAVELLTQYYGYKSQISEDIKNVFSTYIAGIGRAVWEFNEPQLRDIMEGIVKSTQAAVVQLKSDYYDFQVGEMPQSIFLEINNPVTFSYEGNKQALGELIIYVDSGPVVQNLMNFAGYRIVTNLVKSVLMLFFSFFVFRLLVIRHLEYISAHTRSGALTSQSYSPFILPKRNPFFYRGEDELDNVVKALNEMSVEIIRRGKGMAHAYKQIKDESNKNSLHLSYLGGAFEHLETYVSVFNKSGDLIFTNRALHTAHPKLNQLLAKECRDQRDVLGLLNKIGMSVNEHSKTAGLWESYRKVKYYIQFHNEDQHYWNLYGVEFDDGAFAMICIDINEMKSVQFALRKAKKMEAIGTLASGIAHEFNNKLAILQGTIEQARFEIGNDILLSSHLEKASDTIQSATNTTRNLLASSHQSKTISEEVRPIRELMEKTETSIKAFCPEGVKMNVECHSTMAMAINPEGLSDALVNLSRNAIQAMNEKGMLNISVFDAQEEDILKAELAGENAYICIKVSDTGKGVPPQYVEKIFEPFFTTKPVGEGTGLGLWVIYNFVEQNGGNIRFERKSETEHGFVVTLPAVKYAQNRQRKKRSAPVHDGFPKISILFVDDEIGLLNIFKKFFERLGAKVTIAPTCQDAYEALKAQNGQGYDVLVCDKRLPDGAGAAVIEEYLENNEKGKAFLYSGNIEEGDGIEGKDVALLNKPITLSNLQEKIREAMG